MRSLLSQFYICQKYRSIEILSERAPPLYSISMRLSKTKIIHKGHRNGERNRRRTRRISDPIEQQTKRVKSKNRWLSINEDTSSQSSSSSIEQNMHNSAQQQYERPYSNNKQIIQSKQTYNEKLNHILSKQQQNPENKVEVRQPLLNSIQKELGQTIEDEQQGRYFFLGDEDQYQEEEDSSQSDSDQDDEVQDEDDESDAQDHQQINQSSKKEDSDDDSDDDESDDSLDEDYAAQFDDEINLYGPNFKGQSEEEIQQEMNEYEYYQKEKINDMSLPSNFNHYQLPAKDKQDFMNILNQMYHETMVTEKKRKKKRTKQISKMDKDEGEQQQKVQVVKRTAKKRVIFNQNISYRLFNKAETIEEMIQQQEQFEQINHVEKGNQKPIMPLQRQRFQQIIPPLQQIIPAYECTKRTAQYLQSDNDNQKEKSDQILQTQSTPALSQPIVSQQFAELQQHGRSQQLALTNDANKGQINIQISYISDENTQSFAVGQTSSSVKSHPILIQHTCDGV